jgi:hypothetical protein
MGIGMQEGMSGLAIGSAVSPRIGAVTGFLTGITTGRLFGDKRMPQLLSDADGSPIRVSVITNTAHNYSAEPTKLTIENGARLSDHVIIEPLTITITFEVSNVEAKNWQDNSSPNESIFGEFSEGWDNANSTEWTSPLQGSSGILQKFSPVGKLGGALKNRGVYAKSILQALRKVMEDRKPLTLATQHEEYKNMVITSLSAEEPAPYKGKLEFTLTLSEVRMVALNSMGRPNAKTGTAKTKRAVDNPVRVD